MVTAATTDVRAWLRANGEDVPARGALPAHLRALYDDAHPAGPVVPGVVIEDTGGVTEADFPPADDSGPAERTDPVPRTESRERAPRAVRSRPAAGSGLRERIFGGTPKPAAKKTGSAKAAPRTSLSDWAEETWADLAWLAGPVPPLEKILTIQAPYAGVVFDDQVKGTFIDSMLQPVAKYSGTFRALNGLCGPPVYVAMICAVGARVQVLQPDGKTPVLDSQGQPVTDFDGRTKMLFQGLRYSLLQMTKIGEVNAEQIQARAQASVERTRAVEMMIATIFDMPAPSASPPPSAPRSGGGEPNGYQYPDVSATFMDGTGADPGRI
jgi:hypothetical protein